jgi:hypothetical protein
MTNTADNFMVKAILILLAACVMCAAIILGVHAIERHGSDAVAIRKCMDDRGPFQKWLERDGCATHNLVKLDDGRVGDQITVKGEDGRTYEVTSYVPKCGILCQIENWLNQTKGAKRIWTK